jgi:nitrous oxide reductase accessory protein NosL
MTTKFEIGARQLRPPEEPQSWFHDVLEEIRAERDGAIPIRIEASTGHQVDGMLVEADPAISPGPHGKVSLNSHGEDLVIGSEMIAAFTLLPGTATKKPDESED